MDKWSDVQIFESYDDTDSTFLFLSLAGLEDELKMNKIQFTNYPEVLKKIKKLTPLQKIKYRTTMSTHAGYWSQDEWFSDIEVIGFKESFDESKADAEILKFKIGSKVQDLTYGQGTIKDLKKISDWTVLTIKFDLHEELVKKILNINEMKVIY